MDHCYDYDSHTVTTITRCYYLHAVTTVLPPAVTNIVLVVGEVGVDDHILDDHVLLAPRHIIPIIPDYRLLAFRVFIFVNMVNIFIK